MGLWVGKKDRRFTRTCCGFTGDRTALVTARPFRAPHHTISDVVLLAGGRCRCRARFHLPIIACSFWMNCRSAAATSARPCASPQRRVSYTDDLQNVLDLTALAELSARAVPRRAGVSCGTSTPMRSATVGLG